MGLEEVVLDQALFDGEFIQEFNEAEYKLKAVSQYLCLVVSGSWQNGNILTLFITRSILGGVGRGGQGVG